MDLLSLCESLQEAAKGHLGAMKAGVGGGWKGGRLFYARLTPSGASAGSQSDKVELAASGRTMTVRRRTMAVSGRAVTVRRVTVTANPLPQPRASG